VSITQRVPPLAGSSSFLAIASTYKTYIGFLLSFPSFLRAPVSSFTFACTRASNLYNMARNCAQRPARSTCARCRIRRTTLSRARVGYSVRVDGATVNSRRLRESRQNQSNRCEIHTGRTVRFGCEISARYSSSVSTTTIRADRTCSKSANNLLIYDLLIELGNPSANFQAPR